MSAQVLNNVLDEEELASLRKGLANANFASGLGSNPTARGIKHNLQWQPDQSMRQLGAQIQQALFKHPHFGPLVLPKRSSEPFFAKYTEGMYYREHIDEPLLRGQITMRTDVSCTVFVSDPTDYKGGELQIGEGDNAKTIKLSAGDAVLYPSSSIHQITQVTAGERIVALCWFESLIRDPGQRQLVYQLDTALAAVIKMASADCEPARKIALARANLIRMWADS